MAHEDAVDGNGPSTSKRKNRPESPRPTLRRRRKVECKGKHHYEWPPLTNETLAFAFTWCMKNGTLNHPTFGPIDEWDTSQVTVMTHSFNSIRILDSPDRLNVGMVQPDISCWDTSSVTKMRFMFTHCKNLPFDLSKWDVSNVVSMQGMFMGTNMASLTGLERWKTDKVTDMSNMFDSADGFKSDLSDWNTSCVTNMGSMFKDLKCTQSFRDKRKRIDLSSWDTSKVTEMDTMFQGSTVSMWNISKWDVSNVVTMRGMFCKAHQFKSDLSLWNVRRVTDMHSMFQHASEFESDLSLWKTPNVTDMSRMFHKACLFTSDLSQWDVSSVTSTCQMFDEATDFTADLSLWNMSKVTNTNDMFRRTSLLSDLTKWDMSEVQNGSGMFVGTEESFGPDLVLDRVTKTWTDKSMREHKEFLAGEKAKAVIQEYRRVWARRRWTSVRAFVRTTRPVLLHWIRETSERRYHPNGKRVVDDMNMFCGEIEIDIENAFKRMR